MNYEIGSYNREAFLNFKLRIYSFIRSYELAKMDEPKHFFGSPE